MLEIARYEVGKRFRGGLYLAVGLGVFAAMFAAFFPSITQAEGLQDYIDSLPPLFVEAFGIRAITTIEGFLATELYVFAWVILLGLYLAYSAASLIAGDVEHERMDVLLSLPVSRARVVREKFLSLLVPIVAVNLLVPVVVYASTVAVGATIDPVRLLAVHALSIPYLLACAGIGLVLSVVFDRADVAQRAALGTVFGLFMLETLASMSDYGWLGAVTPMRYYDPTAILVDAEYDLLGAGLLLVAAVALVVASQAWFGRIDVE